jgi:hypothetical protein
MSSSDISTIENEIKSITFGNLGTLMPPKYSRDILQCLIDPQDFLSRFDSDTAPTGEYMQMKTNRGLDDWSVVCDGVCHPVTKSDTIEYKGDLVNLDLWIAGYCVPWKLLRNSTINLADVISRRAAISWQYAANKKVWDTALNMNAPTNTLQSTNITIDDIFSAIDGLGDGFEDNASLHMNRRTLSWLMQQKDTTGNFLFKVLNDGNLNQIAGVPVVVNRYIGNAKQVVGGTTTIASGVKAIVAINEMKAIKTLTNGDVFFKRDDNVGGSVCSLFQFLTQFQTVELCKDAVSTIIVKA